MIYSNNKEISKFSQAYVSLINVIEKSYSEKNIVKNILEHNYISTEDYNSFLFLISSENSYLDILVKNLSQSQLESFKNDMNSENLKGVDEYREVLFTKVKKDFYITDIKEAQKALTMLSKNIYGVSVQTWEENSSKRIEILEQIKNRLVEDMISQIDENVKSLDNQVIVFVLFITLLIVSIFVIITRMTNRISQSIKNFQSNLDEFFLYSMREKDFISLKEIKGKDEFALMTQNMNKQVEKIERIIENDKDVVREITDIIEKVNNGFFEYTIKAKTSTKELATLVQNINIMIDRTKLKINSLNLLLNNYTQGNYEFKLDEVHKKGMYGVFGTLSSSTLLLGQSSSELIAMITNAGVELVDNNTKILTNSSNELAISSTEQASSPEQSAAALEQITSNIRNNSENMNRMLQIAEELNSAASVGSSSAKHLYLWMR